MNDVLHSVRQKMQRVSESGRALKRLIDTGIIDVSDLGSSVRTAKLSRVYGPQATMAIQGDAGTQTCPRSSTSAER